MGIVVGVAVGWGVGVEVGAGGVVAVGVGLTQLSLSVLVGSGVVYLWPPLDEVATSFEPAGWRTSAASWNNCVVSTAGATPNCAV